MENKEIIIDGIDVSGCKHFKIGTCLADYLLTDMNFSEAKCELCKNCYYKQLKRKEQECEILKMSENEGIEIIAEFKAECEELKEKVKELRQGWINCDKERNLQEANSEFRQRIINRHEQKLEKIRQICNCSKDKMNCDECPMRDECEELCVNNKNLQDIILRIIVEVKHD